MNIINAHARAVMPRLYVAGIDGDGPDSIRRQLRDAVSALEPAAIFRADALALDRADYNRLEGEALNGFLVDAEADAVIWGAVQGGSTLDLHAAVVPWPKVVHAGRRAVTFAASMPLPLDARIAGIAIAQVLGAALAGIATIRPAPECVIERCTDALERGLHLPLERRLSQNVRETLSQLYAVKGFAIAAPGGTLKRAISLNRHLCRQISGTDTDRLVRLLKDRAAILTRLGAESGDASDVLQAIDALRDAAVHVSTDLGLARLDMLLAGCKVILAELQDDLDLLIDARDLTNWAIPFLYRNLAVEDWARAQMTLADIDFRLMMRAADRDACRTYAYEAIDALYEAQNFFSPGHFPIAWAEIVRLEARITDEFAAETARLASGTEIP